MNAKDFKALVGLVSKADEARCNPEGWNKYPIQFDFMTKKEALDWLTFTESRLDFIGDDEHVYVYCGENFYFDEEITPSILKKADYIEMSWGDGYMFYIGKNSDLEALEDAFWSSVGWHLNSMIEWDEMDESILKEIADVLGTTIEDLKAA